MEKILIIDDSPVQASLLASILPLPIRPRLGLTV